VSGSPPLRDAPALLEALRAVHAAIRDAVLAACARAADDFAALAGVVGHEGGDTVFAVDRVSEAVLRAELAELARGWPCLLVAEGLGADGRAVLPAGTREDDVELVVIVDPIDGTRGLMYQKRPAWILTGVARYRRGRPARLSDIVLAVQTEIPLGKQHLADSLWALAGQGARGERWNRLTGERTPLPLRPSGAGSPEQGFGGVARFFPGARAALAAIDDAVMAAVLGPPRAGVAQAFEDQYISTGGQLYELMVGHDRWIADLRPLVDPDRGLCCHPYDICTALIAREAGVVVEDPRGGALDAPLDVHTPVAFAAYANPALRARMAPVLSRVLAERGLLSR
jgi:fructose-1,6-bisphosphatase/inositol monophosphatase family enzyme